MAHIETPHCNRANQEFLGTLRFERVGLILQLAATTQSAIQLSLRRNHAGT